MHTFKLTAALLCTAILAGASEAAFPVNSGHLLYHRYTAYDTMDSTVLLHHFDSGITREIPAGAFVNAMNADFGAHCYDIVFMAIDPAADEWDLYRCNMISGEICNLTENSGFRNEDPKFSPDGNHIVFKRGYWSTAEDDFVYNLAELDLRTGEITLLTDDSAEQSMPYYSADGSAVYYAQKSGEESSIWKLSRETGVSECVYAEYGIHAYYPIASESGVYFAKWFSPSLRNDCIVRLTDDGPIQLPFNHTDYNCSDPFALRDGTLFFSSTENGSYDLCYYDGSSDHILTNLNSELQELGSAYYSKADAEALTAITTDFLLQRNSNSVNMDADGNGVVNAFDLAFIKRSVE